MSSLKSPLRTTTVPKRTPCSHSPPPQLPDRTTARIWSGVASVVRSMSASGSVRSSRASRTVPPTRYSSCPRSAKRRPRSRTTLANGAAFSSAPRASRWAGESWGMPPQHTRPDPGPVQVVYAPGTRATGSGRRWSDAGDHEDEQGRGRSQGWPDHQEALRRRLLRQDRPDGRQEGWRDDQAAVRDRVLPEDRPQGRLALIGGPTSLGSSTEAGA